MAHNIACGCVICRGVRDRAVNISQADRNLLAAEWSEWISEADGEAAKLRAGEDGAPGSPRWVALQAIARARAEGQPRALVRRGQP